MSKCINCGFENPADSKFCASCGVAMPTSSYCPGCGAENPPGSKFCKQCGGALDRWRPPGAGFNTVTQSSATGSLSSSVFPWKPGPISKAHDTARQLLWGTVGLYAVAAYFNYSSMVAMAQLGPFVDTSTTGFLLTLCFVLGGFSGFAAMKLGKGEVDLAKKASIANSATGAITLFLFHNALISIALNGGLLVMGIWCWRLLNQVQRPLI